MKHIKTFENFIGEGHLPFAIEKKVKLNGMEFELDEERTEEDDDNRFDIVQVFCALDKNTGNEWVS